MVVAGVFSLVATVFPAPPAVAGVLFAVLLRPGPDGPDTA